MVRKPAIWRISNETWWICGLLWLVATPHSESLRHTDPSISCIVATGGWVFGRSSICIERSHARKLPASQFILKSQSPGANLFNLVGVGIRRSRYGLTIASCALITHGAPKSALFRCHTEATVSPG